MIERFFHSNFISKLFFRVRDCFVYAMLSNEQKKVAKMCFSSFPNIWNIRILVKWYRGLPSSRYTQRIVYPHVVSFLIIPKLPFSMMNVVPLGELGFSLPSWVLETIFHIMQNRSFISLVFFFICESFDFSISTT